MRVDNSLTKFACGCFNTYRAADQGGRIIEGRGFVVFKDGSHPVHTTWSLFSYSSDTVQVDELPKGRDICFVYCRILVHFLWVLHIC